MKAVVMNEKMKASIEEVDKPKIRDNEVLIKVKSAGVCGSDLHYFSSGKIGDKKVNTPYILGHEIAGIIEECGQNVKKFNKGDRVAIEPGIACGKCWQCKVGHYNLCEDMKFLATPPINGGFKEYIAYPEDWVYKLPDNVSFDEGALIEPLAVGMHAAELTNSSLGETVFIFGCGCIGLLTLLTLKARGISKVYMCDLVENRIHEAEKLGATKVFNGSQEDIVKKMNEFTAGHGVDVVYEMTGSSIAVAQTVDIVRTGGQIILVGLGNEDKMVFEFQKLIWKEIQIKTCFRYKNIYPKAINILQAKTINVLSVISDVVEYKNAPSELVRHVMEKNEIIKMMIHF